MRPTTSSQRSRSRLADLAAAPGPADGNSAYDAVHEADLSAGSGGWAPEIRGPAAPAWLAQPRPESFSGSAGALPAAAEDWDQEHESGALDAEPDTPAMAEVVLERQSRLAEWVPERWRGARFAISGRGLVVLALLGLAAAAIAGVGAARDQPASVPVPELPQISVPIAGAAGDPDPPDVGASLGGSADRAAAPEEIVVSVQGLVGASGLVRLDTGARVADAIAAAGGALDGADLRSLNLAQRLGDGDQVLVGIEPTDGAPPQLGSATITAGAHPGGAGPTASPSGGIGGVNLNTATVGELEALPGVGPVTAQSIVDWRAANGRFATVDQLSEVRGIGPARLASLRDLVTV